MPRKMKGTDFFQATEPDLLFRDVSLYTQTISSAEQAPLVVRQAIAAGYAGPGVAHLTLPQDVLSSKAVGTTTSPAVLQPRAEISPDESRIAEVVERIDAAQTW
jgi:pyruvate dehydrogenase (quinone)